MEARGFGWTRKGEYYSDAVTPLDLITECTANGSPIQPKPSKREAIAALEAAVLSLQARVDALEAAAVKPERRVTGWFSVENGGALAGPFNKRKDAHAWCGSGEWPVYIDATEGDEP